MTKYTQKIGWQKYEDMIEQQLSSPLFETIMQNMAMQSMENYPVDEDDDEEDYEPTQDRKKDDKFTHDPMMIPITSKLIEDITLLANFDCWMAHTNFDITHKIKDKLNKIPGIEVLRVCSRYRFFVGIGQMFDFKDVRHSIDKEIIKGDIDE
jgi:hypothetical protein